jgi:hypothetical protein
VVIDAQINDRDAVGGVVTVLMGLVRALGRLDGLEEYVIIGPWQDPDWLRPYIGPNQRIVPGAAPHGRLKSALGALGPVARSTLAPGTGTLSA